MQLWLSLFDLIKPKNSVTYEYNYNYISYKSFYISSLYRPDGHPCAPGRAPSGGLVPRPEAACDGRQPWCSAPGPGPSAQPSAAGAPSSASGWSSHSGHSQETIAKHREGHASPKHSLFIILVLISKKQVFDILSTTLIIVQLVSFFRYDELLVWYSGILNYGDLSPCSNILFFWWEK